MKKQNILQVMLLSAAGVLLISSCAPVFNEMQSARTVGENRVEVAGSYTSVNSASDGESDHVQNEAGFHLAYGISDNVDIRARYEAIWLDGGDNETVSVWGIGPKFSIVEDKVSFYMPVGNGLGDYDDNWQLHPTFLFSFPLKKDEIEFTVAPKYLLTFCDDCDDGVAFNFGLSLGNLNKWALRLEYGLLYNVQEFGDGHNNQLSVGVSYTFGKEKDVQ